MIKASYKNKKLSIPLSNIDDKGMMETMTTHIVRFQKEILSKYPINLENTEFDPALIENWKTVAPGDALKDYYFQTGKSLKPFKGQILEIQPVWKKSRNH